MRCKRRWNYAELSCVKRTGLQILTEPFMVGFVNYAINLRMMQSPMHPIDSIIREQKKARRKVRTLINRREVGRTMVLKQRDKSSRMYPHHHTASNIPSPPPGTKAMSRVSSLERRAGSFVFPA